MEDVDRLTGCQMLARRASAEQEISRVIGQLIFAFSRLVDSLHLCVAWHNDGTDVASYGETAQDAVAARLIRQIERQAATRFGEGSRPHGRYTTWAVRAHAVRQHRNIVMHARWGMEAYGRHAVATTTPVFVEPQQSVIYTAGRLVDICTDCDELARELSRLRQDHPL